MIYYSYKSAQIYPNTKVHRIDVNILSYIQKDIEFVTLLFCNASLIVDNMIKPKVKAAYVQLISLSDTILNDDDLVDYLQKFPGASKHYFANPV